MPDSRPLTPPVLFLDAASPRLCGGLEGADEREINWRETNDEAGVGLFRVTDELLRAAGLGIGDAHTVVFCEGPGSLLGIRLVAMAVRTWTALPRVGPLRVWSYRSLALVAADLLAQGEAPPFHVCSDARRETWNVLTVAADGLLGAIHRSGPTGLPDDGRAVFIPETFPHWQPLPAQARTVPYRPRLLPELAARYPLLQETDSPDAFMIEMPTYRTWNPT